MKYPAEASSISMNTVPTRRSPADDINETASMWLKRAAELNEQADEGQERVNVLRSEADYYRAAGHAALSTLEKEAPTL